MAVWGQGRIIHTVLMLMAVQNVRHNLVDVRPNWVIIDILGVVMVSHIVKQILTVDVYDYHCRVD